MGQFSTKLTHCRFSASRNGLGPQPPPVADVTTAPAMSLNGREKGRPVIPVLLPGAPSLPHLPRTTSPECNRILGDRLYSQSQNQHCHQPFHCILQKSGCLQSIRQPKIGAKFYLSSDRSLPGWTDAHHTQRLAGLGQWKLRRLDSIAAWDVPGVHRLLLKEDKLLDLVSQFVVPHRARVIKCDPA